MIIETALKLGFDACGIAKADELKDDAVYMQEWLESGNQGEMHYLERNIEKRIDPRKLVPGCKSVVVVLMNYYPIELQNNNAPRIAKYAYSKIDYHQAVKDKLRKLEIEICNKYGSQAVNNDVQHLFVDSAPVLERSWAEKAGLGWRGKNTLLIHPGLGSYTFIGVLMLNIETPYNEPISNRCGTCTRCIDACPTQALSEKGMNARKCISYLTIEFKGEIPQEQKDHLSNCMLGCDICADVCPWNKKWAKPHAHSELNANEEHIHWNTNDWLSLTEQEFKRIFKHSAVKRAGFTKLMQNIANIKIVDS